MSDHFIHQETYVHASGKQYRVVVEHDDWTGAPDKEYPDSHGELVELLFDPTDDDAVQDHLDRWVSDDDHLEQRARYALMRPLGQYRCRYRGEVRYYDVWETRKKAIAEWGVPPEKAGEVVDKDYAYLQGWYDDDWHWCSVTVYALDEDGEMLDDYSNSCSGFESTIIEPKNRAQLVEVIEDSIHSIEHEIRRAMHLGQLELPLFA